MIHSSKQAYVAIADHRDAYGRFDAGDIVIVAEPALVDMLVAEGSIDPAIVVDASYFISSPKAESPAAANDRMVKAPGGRRAAASKAAPATTDTTGAADEGATSDGGA